MTSAKYNRYIAKFCENCREYANLLFYTHLDNYCTHTYNLSKPSFARYSFNTYSVYCKTHHVIIKKNTSDQIGREGLYKHTSTGSSFCNSHTQCCLALNPRHAVLCKDIEATIFLSLYHTFTLPKKNV